MDYNVKNGFSLFWGGPYSQWAMSPFTFFDIDFNCCEQFALQAVREAYTRGMLDGKAGS